jgi:TetR/AcrR family transcriptional repressor of nem operon
MGRARTFDDLDILERAMRLFWRNGYNGTSMRDLMAETGLAKASIYNAYGNKKDLFHCVLNHYIDKKQPKSLQLLTQGSGRDGLESYFSNILRVTIENHQTPGCLLVNTATEQGIHDEAMRSIVERGMERAEKHLAMAIERGVVDGSIDPETHPETAALCLIATILGIRVIARKRADASKVETLIKANLDKHAPRHKPADGRKLTFQVYETR